VKRILDPATYWKLRAVCGDAQRCAVMAMAARDALATSQKAQADYLKELGFDPTLPTFTLDDIAMTVDVPDTPTPAPPGKD